MNVTMRPLNPQEIEIVTRVASHSENAQKDGLLRDLRLASVDSLASTNTRVSFVIKGHVRPPYRGQHTYGIDGCVQDIDGATILVLLFADESGRLFEMELIRGDGKPIRGPDWTSLVVSEDVSAKPTPF